MIQLSNNTATISKLRAELYLLFIPIIFGSSFVAVKVALGYITPFLFLSLRFLLAAVIMMILFRKSIMRIDRKTLLAGFVVGFFIGIAYGTITYGLNYITASKSVFIVGTFVVFVPIFSVIFEKIIPRKLLWFGIFLAVAGLYLLTTPEGNRFNIGDGITAIGSVALGAHTVALQIYSKRHDFVQLAFLQIFAIAVGSLLAILLFETPAIEINFSLISIIVGTAMLPTVLSFYIVTKYQRHTSSTRAAIIYSFEPVTGALTAYFILGESLGMKGILGGALIFAGMIVSGLKKSKS